MNEAPEHGLHIVGPVATTPGAPPAATRPSRWVSVLADGSVVAYAGKVEFGQGIRTGFAIEVADELRVPLERVRVVLGDTALVPWDMGTFGSQSTARTGLQLRRAAATAREALLEMAADRLDLPADTLIARGGRIAPAGGGRGVAYEELVAGTEQERDVDDAALLTRADEFSIMGRDHARCDALERVTGRAIFAQDTVIDGMLFAAVLRAPSHGATLSALDVTAAERMPGVAAVVRDGDLVAALADTDEHAEAAAAALQATWDEAPATASTLDLPELLLRSARDAFVTQEAGALDDGFRTADAVLEGQYYVPYVSNAPMEPRAAVARWDGDRLTVWAGTQRPFGIRTELAQRFGLEEDAVRVIAPEIGGGFGSKSPYPAAHEAARLARVAGRPVRVAYSRLDEMQTATVRPAALFNVKSGFTNDGRIVAWQFDAYHAGDRPFLGRRGSETPYDITNARVTTYTCDSPLAAGSYRSLGGAANHFAREVHIDEIAGATGLDPVELRLRNLAHPRFRRVLERAAEAHGWRPAAAPSRRGAGVALGLDVGSYAATVVQASVRGGEARVERVTAALDCGLVVNPEGVRNQVEGSIVMGLGTALSEIVEFHGGRVLSNGFARYRVPRAADAPVVETVLVGDADTPSTGAGEPAIVPIAAAIANAVSDATGERQRELPINRHLR